MRNIYVLLGLLLIFLIQSCIDEKNKQVESLHKEKEEYVMDKTLTTDFYKEYAGYIPVEGIVPNAKVAVGIAQSVCTEIYGKDLVEKEKPFRVNLNDDIWIVEGTLHSNGNWIMFGGTIHVEIRKSNGEIIKVFHSK
jgi:hypothetical protein